jgi:hypothetical protein
MKKSIHDGEESGNDVQRKWRRRQEVRWERWE